MVVYMIVIQMFQRVSIMMFHGGHFVQSPSMKYVNGIVANFDNMYTNLFLIFEMQEMAKELGYPIGIFNLYYRLPSVVLEEELRDLAIDGDVLQMVKCYDGLPVIQTYVESTRTTCYP